MYFSFAHDDDEALQTKKIVKTVANVKADNTPSPSKLPISCPRPSVPLEAVQEIVETEDGEQQCPYCQYTNKATQPVKDHINKVHERLKWYGCPLCGFNSSSKNTTINHLKNTHDLLTNDAFINSIQLYIRGNVEPNKKVCKIF